MNTIFNIEATNMGNSQTEIAGKIMEMVDGKEFNSKAEFDELEGSYIAKACKELGWDSVPQSGGLVVEWSQ